MFDWLTSELGGRGRPASAGSASAGSAGRRLHALGAAWLAVAMFLAGPSLPAAAQSCGTDYTIKEGDSLAKIATAAYGKASQWTVIFYANQDRLGANSSLLVPGLSIRIPCVGGTTPALPATATLEATTEGESPAAKPVVTAPLTRRIEFLTADDYAPFTGRQLPNGGMATDVITSAMTALKAATGDSFDFSVSWVNDWSAHLNPLLVTRAFDMGYPWYKPDCEHFGDLDKDAKYRCQKFFFSDPLFEEPVLFFVRAGSDFTYESDAEIPGKSLCRPAGNWTFDLDQNGRNWVKDHRVVLMQPQTWDDCFRLLEEGSVEMVAGNELTGRASVIRLGLTGKVKIIERPLAILTLHVIVPKTHPNARTLLYYVNDALKRLKEAGDYDKIVEKHLTLFWESQAEVERAPEPTGETAVEGETKAAAGTDAAAATEASGSN
ncbi:MAG: transporter substrate-binding domain-containing protein [Hyphomicrobiaceae bacterium]